MSRMPLLDVLHAPATIMPVDPHGATIPRSEIDEILRLPMKRYVGDQARIQLHRDRGLDLWMWATWHEVEHGGGGYRVGPKWGKFAETRESALHWAINELLDRIADYDTPQARRIRTWLEGLA